MTDLVAVLVATVVAFVAGGAYYAVLGDQLEGDRDMPAWKLVFELGRCLVLAAVVIGLASEIGVGDAGGGLLLGAVLWVGFPLVLWTGAMLHERTPLRIAAIHAGDWLVKLLLISVLATV
jgi:hypothetical protein